MIWLLFACTTEDPVLTEVLEAETAWTHERYQSSQELVSQLAETAASHCSELDEDGLTAIREAWWSAREPLKQLDVVNFGPWVEEPWRYGPDLDFWPARDEAIEEVLADATTFSTEDVAAMGAATRGMPAIEYVLWVDGDDTLARFTEAPQRCAFVATASQDAADNLTGLGQAWDDPWTAWLTDPSGDAEAPFETRRLVLDEWVNRVAFAVENVRLEKLGKPLGDDSGGEPLLDTLESRWSGRSLQDATDAFVGAHAVLQQVYPLLDAEDQHLADELDVIAEGTLTRLGAVPEPLEDTLLLEPEIVAEVQEALLTHQVVVQTELAQALDVTITFNDNDGD